MTAEVPTVSEGPTDQGAAGTRRSLHHRRHRRWFQGLRQRYPWTDPVLKVVIATLGVVLIVAGIVLAPVPGPGGFIAFIGIAVLAAEFVWVRLMARKSQVVAAKGYTRLIGSRPRWVWRWKKRMTSRGAGS